MNGEKSGFRALAEMAKQRGVSKYTAYHRWRKLGSPTPFPDEIFSATDGRRKIQKKSKINWGDALQGMQPRRDIESLSDSGSWERENIDPEITRKQTGKNWKIFPYSGIPIARFVR